MNVQKKTFSTGYTKLLVGIGYNYNEDDLDCIEIIDLASSSTACRDLPNFPRNDIVVLLEDSHQTETPLFVVDMFQVIAIFMQMEPGICLQP